MEKALEISAVEAASSKPSWRGPVCILLYCAIFLTLKLLQGPISDVHWLYLSAILVFYFFNTFTRNFLVIALPMIVYATMYDFFSFIPFEALMPIHVQAPYEWDLTLFGMSDGGQVWLFHEWVFQKLAHPFWDLLSGVVYFLHIPVVLLLILLFWRYRSAALAQRFTIAFLVINLLAFATYFFYPAAAPWYVAKFGFLAPTAPVPGDPAGLIRFEQLLGLHFFSENYAISPVVFGAIPSMHAGFATLGWLFSFQLGKKAVFWMSVYVAAMYFSAVYLQHHYLIDVLIGIFYALLAWVLVEKVLLKPMTALNRGVLRLFTKEAWGPVFKSR